jgi:hypothetical protein
MATSEKNYAIPAVQKAMRVRECLCDKEAALG